MQKIVQFWFASGVALYSLATTGPAAAQPVPDATLPVNSVVTTTRQQQHNHWWYQSREEFVPQLSLVFRPDTRRRLLQQRL